MASTFHNSPFSRHFNIITYHGYWPHESWNPTLRNLYKVYTMGHAVLDAIILFGGMVDLYLNLFNFRKVIYNLCINMMILTISFKIIRSFIMYDRINDLRRRLHREESFCNDEELELCWATKKELFFLEKIFYRSLFLFLPVWLILHLYNNNPRHLPLPSKWFVELDLDNNFVFCVFFIIHGAYAFVYLLMVVSIELSAFSILLQIVREYKFLEKRVNLLGNIYKDATTEKNETKEFNSILLKLQTKKIMREIIIRQGKLAKCTEDYEAIYSLSMLFHIFLGGFLLVMNGVETVIVSMEFDLKMSYQLGYICMIIVDFFYHCLMATEISSRCREIGMATYRTPWILMDKDLRLDILLILLRSQNPPKLTSGRMMELNLNTFMVLMKNIYGWLALIRQIGFK